MTRISKMCSSNCNSSKSAVQITPKRLLKATRSSRSTSRTTFKVVLKGFRGQSGRKTYYLPPLPPSLHSPILAQYWSLPRASLECCRRRPHQPFTGHNSQSPRSGQFHCLVYSQFPENSKSGRSGRPEELQTQGENFPI